MTTLNFSPPEFEAVESRKGTPTWEIAYLYPWQGEWTDEDYLAIDARTNRPIELSDGCLEFLPLPTVAYQLMVQFVFEELDSHVRRSRDPGRVLFWPCPIRLWKGKYREPKVFYLRPERFGDPRRPPKGVDLAVEIVSDGEENRRRDLVAKRKEYAQARIPEYWIIDPQERRITVLTLDGDEYRAHGEFGPGQTADSVLLPGFTLTVNAVFAAPENCWEPTTDN